MLKVMTIVGTRPELIRLSRVIAKLDQTVNHVLVHTGQNYDYTLNEIFFDELGIRRPDYLLGVDTSSLGHVLGETLIKSEAVLTAEKPDAVLVLGDTNSCIAALMAKRMQIPVYHMEAGNRCFDDRVPEETNRRMVDHVADFNLVYTEHARRNLLAEGLHPSRIALTGSPMREVLDSQRELCISSSVLEREDLEPNSYFVASIHRQETVDESGLLHAVLDGLSQLAAKHQVPVVLSTHPRTRRRLSELSTLAYPGIRFMPPYGFHDYINLQVNAKLVLSDSGTISEESAILGFPAVTLRNSIERPEALDAAGILLVGTDPEDIVMMSEYAMAHAGDAEMPEEYLVSNTSHRVVNFILSTTIRSITRTRTDLRTSAASVTHGLTGTDHALRSGQQLIP